MYRRVKFFKLEALKLNGLVRLQFVIVRFSSEEYDRGIEPTTRELFIWSVMRSGKYALKSEN